MKTVLKLAAVAAAVVALVAVGTAASSGKKVIHDDGNRVTKVIHDDGLRGTALYDAVTGKVIGYQVPVSAEARTVSACPGTTNTCGWILNEFTGDPGFINTMPNTFGACVNVTGFSNNNIESVLNENPFQVSFYDGTNGSGYMFSLAAGAGEGNLAVHPGSGGFQNRISSVCHE